MARALPESGPNAASPTDLVALAHALADRARRTALDYFRQPLDIQSKEDLSPVTIADRKIESEMRALLAERHPSAGLFGEEMGSQNVDAGEVWVLDPIDGTGAYVTGSPLFGCLVGLLIDGRPELGLIEVPRMGERWIASRGAQTTLNGSVCQSSGQTRLADASLSTTSLLAMSERERDGFLRASKCARLTRFGGDCYAYGLLASGYLDAVVETSLQPYDYLQVVPVVEAAGGTMTDWSGAPLSLRSDGRVIAAASPALHDELMRLVND